MVKVGEDGVEFKSHVDGSRHFFTPERSIEVQRAREPTSSSPSTRHQSVARRGLHGQVDGQGRTAGLRRSLRSSRTHKPARLPPGSYGIVQGGVSGDLREASAAEIAALPFDGVL